MNFMSRLGLFILSGPPLCLPCSIPLLSLVFVIVIPFSSPSFMAIYIALPSMFALYLSLVSALVGVSLCF